MLIAEGHSLPAVCERPGMPCLRTVLRWRVRKDLVEFNEMFDLAMQARVERLVAEILEISDDSDGDHVVDPETGQRRFNNENVARDRLRTDSRKWYASKVVPKIYGERITTAHTGADGGPVEMVVRWQE